MNAHYLLSGVIKQKRDGLPGRLSSAVTASVPGTLASPLRAEAVMLLHRHRPLQFPYRLFTPLIHHAEALGKEDMRIRLKCIRRLKHGGVHYFRQGLRLAGRPGVYHHPQARLRALKFLTVFQLIIYPQQGQLGERPVLPCGKHL